MTRAVTVTIESQDTSNTFRSKYGWRLDWIELNIIYLCLKKNGWSRERTASELGVSIRTIRNRLTDLKTLGFEIKTMHTAREELARPRMVKRPRAKRGERPYKHSKYFGVEK
jgi:biotin operon repressor